MTFVEVEKDLKLACFRFMIATFCKSKKAIITCYNGL